MRRAHRNQDYFDKSNFNHDGSQKGRQWDTQEEKQEWMEQKRAERAERKAEREERKNQDEDNPDDGGTDTSGGGTDTGGGDTGGTDTSGGGTDTGGGDTGGTDTSGGGTDTGGGDTGGTDTSGGGTDTGGGDTGGTDTSGGGTDTGGGDTGGTDTSGGGTDTGGGDTGGTDTSGGGTDTADTGGTDETPPPPEPEEPVLLTDYVSSAEGSEFNIHVEFIGEWTIDLQEAFIFASDYLSSVIIGDLTDVNYNGELIDDISITADLTAIDGAGGILGQAGPTAIRTADYLPATGMMQFDIADAETFDSYGYWEQIVLHEMVHTLGFGAMWGYMGLVDGMGTDSPTFTGENATAVYESMFGLTDTNGVPIENDGGAGTAEAHWEESIFGTDLMSGYLSSGTTPELSTLSIASLEDLGYDTIFDYDTFLAG